MNQLRVNVYAVLARAVEEGIEYGWNRARKHVENPTPEQIKSAIYEAVMTGICEYFDFDTSEK